MKGVIKWFADNYVAANLLMFAVMIMGFLTWFSLKKEIFPETSVDMVSVRIPYPNATPEEVERGVCVPVEEEVQDLDGIDRIKSTAAPGYGVINIEVQSGYPVSKLVDEVKTRVDAIDNFPEEAESPVIEELVLNAQVIGVAVSADTDEARLREIAERVRGELLIYRPGPPTGFLGKCSFALSKMMRGEAKITKAEISGTRPYEISVEVPEVTLRRHGLSLDEVAAAIRASSLDLPAGSVKGADGEIHVRTEAKRYRARDFEDIVIRKNAVGAGLKLSQIATVRDGFEDVDLESTFDGHPAMVVNVFRAGNEDTLEVAGSVRRFIEEEAPKLFPPEVKLEVWRDDSRYLQSRLNLLGRNAMVGMGLVLLVLSLFLRPALAFFVALGIPASFLATVMVMPWLGVSLNMISLFAFILVLGIVVDDAIVVGENVYERINQGESPRTAAVEGTHEVSLVVVFGVLTTMAAFTPMLGLSGVSGKIWPNIPLVVIPTLFFSLIQSKLVLPSHLMRLRPENRRSSKNPISLMLRAVEGALNWFVRHVYQPFLRMTLSYRYVTLASFLGLIVFTVTYVATGHMKFRFFPQVDADIVSAKIRLAEGTAFDNTKAAVKQVEAGLWKLSRETPGHPVVKHVLATAGSQPLQMGFGAVGGAPVSSNIAEVTVEMTDHDTRPMSAEKMAAAWRELTGPIPGALELSFASQAAGGGNAIDLELTGNDIPELIASADYVKAKLAEFDGVFDIADTNRAGSDELKLKLTPEGEALGLTLGEVSRQVRQAFYGEEIHRLQRGRDEVKVMLRLPETERRSLNNLDTLRLRTKDGREVPFSTAARYEYGRSAAAIQRADRRRAITVTADVDNARANANEVALKLTEETLAPLRRKFPDVSWGFQGEQKDQRESMRQMMIKFSFALLMIYVLLAVPLRSFLQPLLVMSVIPFGIIGAVAGHYIMGMTLSIMSMCGIVALAGIAVNDSLVLVDFVNRYREAGHSVREAAQIAGARRFRPVLLTSLTTFVGLFPMVLETDLQARFLIPMAVALSFGILFATAITLFLLPALYMVLEDARAFVRWFMTGRWEETLLTKPVDEP